jgi:hypothetical protein
MTLPVGEFSACEAVQHFKSCIVPGVGWSGAVCGYLGAREEQESVRACVITSCECDVFASHRSHPASPAGKAADAFSSFGLGAIWSARGLRISRRWVAAAAALITKPIAIRGLRAAQVAHAAGRGKIAHLLSARTPNLHIMWHTHINSPAHPYLRQ